MKQAKQHVFINLLLLALGIALILVGAMLFRYLSEYATDRKEAEELRQIARQGSMKDPKSPIDFAALKEINEDTVGWILACGGEIDGPVVQTTDNDFYLTHRFDKTEGSVGTFFADENARPAFDCSLTVVYGHNRKDGSMFHPLLNYKEEAYYKAHPTFTVYTEEGEKTYHIFSAFYADYWNIDAMEDDMDIALERSLYETKEAEKLRGNTETTTQNNIVVLSTCEYSGDNNRMVVYGILTEE
ncbi:MAG: class B sortase [Lachnospiraceae bacterium]|nr:class B sortase [Lachnospiraceae bacterium]